MAVELFDVLINMFSHIGNWFVMLLDSTGFTNYYYTAIFVAMVTGFLLKPFGSALSLGSDKAAPAIKSATYRGKYREGAKRTPVGSRGRYERK